MPTHRRGDVWLADLGIAAKVRPCLVLSVPPDPQDRVLITLVPHTTSNRRTRFEVVLPKTFLSSGAFGIRYLRKTLTICGRSPNTTAGSRRS